MATLIIPHFQPKTMSLKKIDALTQYFEQQKEKELAEYKDKQKEETLDFIQVLKSWLSNELLDVFEITPSFGYAINIYAKECPSFAREYFAYKDFETGNIILKHCPYPATTTITYTITKQNADKDFCDVIIPEYIEWKENNHV